MRPNADLPLRLRFDLGIGRDLGLGAFIHAGARRLLVVWRSPQSTLPFIGRLGAT